MASDPFLANPADGVAPRADLAIAAVFMAVGIGIIWQSLSMPTFVGQGGDPFTAPGIVPGFHGVVITLLSLVLALRSIKRGAFHPDGGGAGAEPPQPGTSNARLAVVVALLLIFAVGLIGRVPFWLATALFVSSFIGIFEWPLARDRRDRIRRVVSALVIGLVMGVAVVWVFQDIFLVRLP
ncbi:MAG: tripartite tricarboxylate transporter TctB family protein, partial [Acidobacteriota bacterium]